MTATTAIRSRERNVPISGLFFTLVVGRESARLTGSGTPSYWKDKSFSTGKRCQRPGIHLSLAAKLFHKSGPPHSMHQVILGGRVAKETRRTVDLGHSSDGPSLIDLAEIHVNVPESRFVACLHLQQNRPEAVNDEFMRSAARCRSAANDRTQVVPFGARHSSL